jgi:hypothetical protein
MTVDKGAADNLNRGRKVNSVIALALGIAFAAVPARADIILMVTGQVTSSGVTSIPVGTSLTTDLFYNPADVPAQTVSFPGGGGEAVYDEPSNSTVLVGGSTITAGLENNIHVAVDYPVGTFICCIQGGDDGIEWTGTISAVTGPLASDPAFNLAGLNPIYFTFEAPHANGVITSTALPSIFPSFPGQWTDASFFFSSLDTEGTITSVTAVTTPEPGSIVLLLLTVVALGGYKLIVNRKKQRHSAG